MAKTGKSSTDCARARQNCRSTGVKCATASKVINAVKLKAMGFLRVKQVCEFHANRAITYRLKGNQRMLEVHCNLLNQCAAVGRELVKSAMKGK